MMKKGISLFLCLILPALAACKKSGADTLPTGEADVPAAVGETAPPVGLSPESEADVIREPGEATIDAASFELFDQYFYGRWIGAGTERETTFGYSEYVPSSMELVKDISLDARYAYLVLRDITGDRVYLVPVGEPSVMYEYDCVVYGETKVSEYDRSYTKQALTEDSSLGSFGIRRLLCLEKDVPEELLVPGVLEMPDGRTWINYKEKMTVVDRSENAICLEIRCREEGSPDPFTPGYEEPPVTAEILYTLERIEGEWINTAREYAAPDPAPD